MAKNKSKTELENEQKNRTSFPWLKFSKRTLIGPNVGGGSAGVSYGAQPHMASTAGLLGQLGYKLVLAHVFNLNPTFIHQDLFMSGLERIVDERN